MKLIDKEKIRYTDLAEGQCPDGVWVAWKDWIDKIPTVEAIPVEWIRKYIDSTLDEGNSQMLGFKAAIIKEMVEEWEKENETDRC